MISARRSTNWTTVTRRTETYGHVSRQECKHRKVLLPLAGMLFLAVVQIARMGQMVEVKRSSGLARQAGIPDGSVANFWLGRERVARP
jgi:hypothetical protein